MFIDKMEHEKFFVKIKQEEGDVRAERSWQSLFPT
jgi:hypothetical protein